MSRKAKISVLIADDSFLARRALRAVFSASQDFLVVGEAENGRQAIELAESLRPDLVTMDLDMPEQTGLEATEEIMARSPTRILVVTSKPNMAGSDPTFEVLSRGALDLLPKPLAWPPTSVEATSMLDRARLLARVPVIHHVNALRKKRQGPADQLPAPAPVKAAAGHLFQVVLIGASTGGPAAAQQIVSALPGDYPIPIVYVQHLAAEFADSFIRWVGSDLPLVVTEAGVGLKLEGGHLYVAARGPHVGISRELTLTAESWSAPTAHCPCVDALFAAAAKTCGPGVCGILLSGMGEDGAIGLKAIRDRGGTTIAQGPDDCAVFGMPKAAIDRQAACHVLTLRGVVEFLIAHAHIYTGVG